ncbi:undecaprenyl-diphosphate phosphatase [Enterococcus faecium]|uniref:undecaprenyl-diphosphate phosphatase n=1 Tax=Enterococcus faecium TaxID=1352 RepID=UPI003F41F4A0
MIAFVVGFLVIAFLMQYLKKGSFLPFVIYRIVLGVVVIVLLLPGVVPAESPISPG